MSRPEQEDTNLLRFGKKVASLRKRQGYTQQQLAERAGLAIDTIAAIENGRRWARLTTLHFLAKGLNVKIDEIFKGL